MPTHHLSDELLLDYAAGNLDAMTGMLVATHLALCPICRAAVSDFDLFGGSLLETLPTANLTDGALDRAMTAIEGMPVDPPHLAAAAKGHPATDLLPRPLRDVVGDDVERLDWRRRFPGVQEAFIATSPDGPTASLLRIQAGRAVPRHTHQGEEYTMVLSGGFTDHLGSFRRGDVAITDDTVQHRPVADLDGDCLCLAVTDAPLHFAGPLGWLINPFLRA